MRRTHFRDLDEWRTPLRGIVRCRLLVASFALSLIASSGCGGSSDAGKFKAIERTTAAGAVTFDGKPVPGGTVVFRQKDSGNRAVCQIKDGNYSSPNKQGPQPGLNVVEVFGRETNDPYAPFVWGGSFTQEVTVEKGGYKGDFAVTKDKVNPAPPPPKKDDQK